MALMVQAIRGMNDLLPEDTSIWQQVEKVLKDTLSSYGYSEVRMPIVEKTNLFCRAIGEVTDVVEKEMYGGKLKTALKSATLGNDAGIIGAAALLKMS